MDNATQENSQPVVVLSDVAHMAHVNVLAVDRPPHPYVVPSHRTLSQSQPLGPLYELVCVHI